MIFHEIVVFQFLLQQPGPQLGPPGSPQPMGQVEKWFLIFTTSNGIFLQFFPPLHQHSGPPSPQLLFGPHQQSPGSPQQIGQV